MGNLPDTYHVLVTLHNVTGEESDLFLDPLQDEADRLIRRIEPDTDDTHATVQHLTPETLPDRYIEVARVAELLHGFDGGSALDALDLIEHLKALLWEDR